MAKYLHVTKNNLNQLEAADLEAEKAIGKLNPNEVIKITYSKVRNYEHHKKFFSMINLVFENQNKYEELEDLLVEVKLKCGHYKEHLTLKGVIIYIPKSMDFSRMDQNEFEVFYNKAVNVVLKHLVAIDNEVLINEIVRY